jgi:hypothetical protein
MSADIPSLIADELRLPELPLSGLPEGTKAYLLARATESGKPIQEVMRDIWNDAAACARYWVVGSTS